MPLLCGASGVAIVFSIAVSQILLGLAIVALFASRTPVRFPPLKLPLAIFAGWTLLAAAASPNPMGAWPQIKKLLLFAVLLVICSGIRNVKQARWTLLAVVGASVLSSLWSFQQFARRIAEAHARGENFYEYYLPRRTTGFMSHWMTFSGELLVAIGIALAFLLFAARTFRERWLATGAMSALVAALVLNQTRGVWLAAIVVAGYLVACWRPKWLFAIPVLAGMGWLAAPDAIRERIVSIVRPHGTQDSNQHRIIVWRTGLAMMAAHPLLGVGPERVGPEFITYLPADIPKPLPEGYYAHVHNVYLQYGAERGLPAILAILWLLGKMAVDWIAALRSGGDRFLLHSAIAALIGVALGGMTEYNLGNSEILQLFLTVAGCGYVAVYTAKHRDLGVP